MISLEWWLQVSGLRKFKENGMQGRETDWIENSVEFYCKEGERKGAEAGKKQGILLALFYFD